MPVTHQQGKRAWCIHFTLHNVIKSVLCQLFVSLNVRLFKTGQDSLLLMDMYVCHRYMNRVESFGAAKHVSTEEALCLYVC